MVFGGREGGETLPTGLRTDKDRHEACMENLPMRDRNEVASSLFFGTFHVPTYML